MTFYPLEHTGIRPIGWQGIIPAKAHKMATKAVDLVISKLISVEEQFDKLDADEIVKELKPQMRELSRFIIKEAMQAELPLVWRLLSERRKEQLYIEAEAQFPEMVRNLLAEVKNDIHNLFDVKRMMIEGLTDNPEMLNKIFLTCGEKEFKFIEKSGFYFGFLFGVIQMFVWNYFQYWWLLPLGGLVVGYITNFLALKLIFRPIHPVKIGPITIQGLFMKRQNEVSEEYSRILANDLLTAEHIFEFIAENNGVEAVADLCRKQVNEIVDSNTGAAPKAIMAITGTTQRYERIKHLAAEMLVHALPSSITSIFDYADKSLQIGPTLESKLKSLSKTEFEDVLHPIFKEDETTLIIVGAVLGGIAGLIQMIFVL